MCTDGSRTELWVSFSDLHHTGISALGCKLRNCCHYWPVRLGTVKKDKFNTGRETVVDASNLFYILKKIDQMSNFYFANSPDLSGKLILAKSPKGSNRSRCRNMTENRNSPLQPSNQTNGNHLIHDEW